MPQPLASQALLQTNAVPGELEVHPTNLLGDLGETEFVRGHPCGIRTIAPGRAKARRTLQENGTSNATSPDRRLFLDLFGLTVDLAPVVLDVDAQRGTGRLLGNLLCALTGLLDGAVLDLGAIGDLLDLIGDLLG